MFSVFKSKEPGHPIGGQFIRDIVFGANDGVVTSIGFLVGLTGAIAQSNLIVIGGTLTIIAGAASMALGNYLATKSEKEFYEAQSKVEEWEIEHKRDEEIAEVRTVFKNQGFNEEDVNKLTDHVINNRKLWLEILMRYELGMNQSNDDKHPVAAGIIMGLFYLIAGLPPLLPYMLVGTLFSNVYYALFAAIALALLVMVAIGTMRYILNRGNFGRTITETIIIGIIATLVGFLAGQFLNALGISATV